MLRRRKSCPASPCSFPSHAWPARRWRWNGTGIGEYSPISNELLLKSGLGRQEIGIKHEHDSERSGPAASHLFSISKHGVIAMKRICLLLVWLLVMSLLAGPSLAQSTKEADSAKTKESTKA